MYQDALRVGANLLDWTPPALFRGENCVTKLPGILKRDGLKKPLIVTGPNIYKRGLTDTLTGSLDENGIEYKVFSDVKADPDIKAVEEARRAYISGGCDCIIAFGGGSPMDCAKVAGARVANPSVPVRKMRGQFKIFHKLPPIFAVPTTAGTGSETTVAAVVTDPNTHEKFALTDMKLRPKYAFLDPLLTVGLPPAVTAATGMDALTHAVEAYIGRSNTEHTFKCAEQAVALIFANLKTAYDNGKDIKARDNMLYASFLAGEAFTRAYVGYVHAFAHAVGGIYGTPHGLANAVILPHILDWYGPYVYERLAKLAKAAGLDIKGKSSAEAAKLFISEIRSLNATMDIPEHLDFIEKKDTALIMTRSMNEANPFYPVPRLMDYTQCQKFIERIKGSDEA